VLSTAADPTGAGDAFRAGFLAGVCRGLGHEKSAQLGCAMAALVMETSGTQEYLFEPEGFLGRIGRSYGPGVAADMATRIRMPSPAPAKEKV
jgi:adenosine kinase